MSYKSHRTGPDRVFDHLYDPLFITSGTKDIWKENHNSLYRSAPVRIYPQYGTMFTDLPRRPRNYYIQQRNPLPHFPFIDENGNRNNEKAERKCRTAVIGGRDRAKFFNIPLNNEIIMNLQLNIKKDHVCCGRQSLTPTEAFRTVACETVYREQSAQTKPWMPEVVVDDNCKETSELVYAGKTIASTAAPGILEVNQLQRARRRRQLEAKFAQSKNAKDWNMRQEFWRALEWENRVGREEELEYCQQLRLGMVQKMMDSRETKMQKNFTLQMERKMSQLEAEKEKKLFNLRTNHQRTMRRLDRQYGEKSKRSKVLTQEHQQTSFVSYNTDFEARLEDLHKMPTMPMNLERFTQPKVDITKPKQPIQEVKKGLWSERFLIRLYESLKVIQKRIAHQRTAKCLSDIREEVLSYVSTAEPSVESFRNELDYQHAVFLQKIIKGRAIQRILHDGKDSNQELIDQLKRTFKLESVWKAECASDWNEDMLMNFLDQYINQEFARYAEQKEICDRRILAKQEQDRENNELQEEKQAVALDCLDKIFADLNLSESDTTTDQIPESPINDQSPKSIVDNVLSNLVLPEIYRNLSDEQLRNSNLVQQNEQNVSTCTTEDQELVADTIEHILQKIIPHSAEELTNEIINDIVRKTIEMSTSFKELSVESLDKEVGGLLDELCNQLLENTELNDDTDGSGSGKR